MATEYGYRIIGTTSDRWHGADVGRDEAAKWAKRMGFTLIAREVSEPRIVSIRA